MVSCRGRSHSDKPASTPKPHDGAEAGRPSWPILPDARAETPDASPRNRELLGRIPQRRRHHRAVDGVSLSLDGGEVLGIVGESGSGKSVTMLALMGLVRLSGARPGR